MKLPDISLCILTKNDEKILPLCLENAKVIASEIVLIDLGSEDRTIEIAESYGAKIIYNHGNNSLIEVRNIAIEHAVCDWILFLEPWESISYLSLSDFKKLCSTNQKNAYQFLCRKIFSKNEFKDYEWVGNLGKYTTDEVSCYGYVQIAETRLFLRRKDVKFVDNISNIMRIDAEKLGYSVTFCNNIILDNYYSNKIPGTELSNDEKLKKDLERLGGKIADHSDPMDHKNFLRLGNDYVSYSSMDIKDLESLMEGFSIGFGNPAILNFMLDYLFRFGMFEKGIELFEIAKDRWPDDEKIYNSAALMYFGLSQFKLAEKNFNKALVINDKNPDCLENLAKLYLVGGEFDKAENYFKRVLSVDNARTYLKEFIEKIALNQKKMPTLTLCMIAKDEEAYIGRALDSVKNIVDEMIVVDTGSSDRTNDIAGEHGAKVYNFNWGDNFSHARNHALKYAKSDYILWFNADEYIDNSLIIFLKIFKSLLPSKEKEAYLIKSIAKQKEQVNLMLRIADQKQEKSSIRIFPNINGVEFKGKVFENVYNSMKQGKIPLKHIDKDLIRHDSDNLEERKRRKIPAYRKAYYDRLSPEQFLDGAIYFLSLKDMEESLKWFDKAYEYGVNSPWFQSLAVKLAKLYQKRKDKEKGKTIFADLIKKYPDSRQVKDAYGEFLYREGEYQNALDMFNCTGTEICSSQDVDEDREKINCYHAVSLIETGFLENAEKILINIIAKDPLSTLANAGLAYLASMDGNIEGCVIEIDKLLTLINKNCRLTLKSIQDLIALCLDLVTDLKEIHKEDGADIILKTVNRLLEYGFIIQNNREKQCQVEN